MGDLKILQAGVQALGTSAADYEKQSKQVVEAKTRFVGKANEKLGKDLSPTQLANLVTKISNAHTAFTGRATDITEMLKTANQTSGVVAKGRRLLSVVTTVIHRGPELRAQAFLSAEATQLNALLVQAKRKKVELDMAKQTLESVCKSLPVSADNVKKVLNMSASELKTSAQAFYPAAGKAATYTVADEKAETMEELLLKTWTLTDSDDVDVDLLERQLTDSKRVLPKKGLPAFTQLLHFAAKPAEQVCQDIVAAQFAERNTGLKPVSFTSVTFEKAGDQTVIRSEAPLTFIRKEGKKETVIATATAEQVADLSSGKCTMTVRVSGITVNDNATESEIKKLSSAFVGSTEQAGVQAVSSSSGK